MIWTCLRVWIWRRSSSHRDLCEILPVLRSNLDSYHTRRSCSFTVWQGPPFLLEEYPPLIRRHNPTRQLVPFLHHLNIREGSGSRLTNDSMLHSFHTFYTWYLYVNAWNRNSGLFSERLCKTSEMATVRAQTRAILVSETCTRIGKESSRCSRPFRVPYRSQGAWGLRRQKLDLTWTDVQRGWLHQCTRVQLGYVGWTWLNTVRVDSCGWNWKTFHKSRPVPNFYYGT